LASETDQVKALQQAILERAQELSDGDVAQGRMTRVRIIEDAREKIKLMEQKELLSARLHADREYQRQVQASELRIQAELDRNRWGLVQSVMDKITRKLVELHNDDAGYQGVFENLLKHGVATIKHSRLIASVNNDDLTRFHDNWQAIVKHTSGDEVDIKLSAEAFQCTGGVKLISEQGDVMIDNTFEGIIARREDELQRLIFERLFSTVSARETVFDG
jgi:V/A-type H+-transporting ATPase subunit E